MSEHLSPDYRDYFETLERRLSEEEDPSTPQRKPEKASGNEAIRPQRPSVRRGRRRLNPRAVAVLLAILAVVVIGIIRFCRPQKALPSVGTPEQTQTQTPADEAAPTNEETVVFSETDKTAAIPDSNDAQSALVVCAETREIVAAREPHQRLHPASLTKMMTLLEAVETAEDLQDKFIMTAEITDAAYLAKASLAGFSAGEEVTVKDLLYGTILESGADAALGVAVHLAGSEENFVARMNRRAQELGLQDTHFENVTGLYSEGHYSSAYDMAVILYTAMKNPVCREILSTFQYTTAATKQHPDGIQLQGTLFSYMYGTEPETATILGGKTGFINESKYCIASFGKNNETGTEYIAVTLKNSTRWPAVFGQIDLYKTFAK